MSKYGGEAARVFVPNEVVSRNVMRLVVGTQILVFVLLWITMSGRLLPTPTEVGGAFHRLWFDEGLGQELWTSFTLNLEALAWTTGISLVLAYLTVVPFMRPMVAILTKLRYMSMVGFSLAFLVAFGAGHTLKVVMLTFAMSVFFVTSMCDEISRISKEEFDHARTLRMGEWRTVLEVVVIGRFDVALDVMRQNCAIGWMMLTMVEVISRSEGGVGVMLFTQNKFFRLDAIVAIQLSILFLALGQDYVIGFVKRVLCPHSALVLERK
jgi:NitT/TauT family transport system permease protein